MLMEAN